MRYFIAASLIMMILLLPVANHAKAQAALLGVSSTDVIAGSSFFAFYNITATKERPIIGFNLSLVVPSNWKVTPYGASGITPNGDEIKIKWEGNNAIYEGTGATVAHVSFRVTVPLEDMNLKRMIFASGYIIVKEGGVAKKYFVTGKKEISVHKWEPFVFLNLSKTQVIPPAIIIAYVRVLTGPPLYPVAMRNVVVRVEDTVTGTLYNEKFGYWKYGYATDVRLPIRIPLNASGGEQKVYVTVDYEVAGHKLRSYVEYPYKIMKPSEVKIDRIDVPKKVEAGKYLILNATVINPSSFEALGAEFHAKLDGDHKVAKLGDMKAGSFAHVSLKFKVPKSDRNLTLTVWTAWEQEYPKGVKVLKGGEYHIQVISSSPNISFPWWSVLMLVVIGAAAEYVVKRRRDRKAKENSEV